MAAFDAFGKEPCTHRRGGGQVRVHECLGGQSVGAEGRAGVESEPAEPQDPGPQQGQRQRVRWHWFPLVTLAFADHQHDGQRGDTGIDMNHGPAREVEGATLEQPTGRGEDPMGDRTVNEDEPSADEQRVGAELEPVGGRPGDEGRRNHREHHLVRGEGQRRNDQGEVARISGQNGLGRGGQMREAGELEVADEATAIAESQGKADERPQNADQAHGEKVLHQHAEHVFGAHHAAVEERQAGRHEQHQSGGQEHPRGASRIDLHTKFPPKSGPGEGNFGAEFAWRTFRERLGNVSAV